MKYKSSLNLIYQKPPQEYSNDNNIPTIIKPPKRKRKTVDSGNIPTVKDIDKDLNTWYDAYQKTLSNGVLKGVLQRKNASKLKVLTNHRSFPFVSSPHNKKGNHSAGIGQACKVA